MDACELQAKLLEAAIGRAERRLATLRALVQSAQPPRRCERLAAARVLLRNANVGISGAIEAMDTATWAAAFGRSVGRPAAG